MPELPEVETVKNTLEKVYLNKTISKVDVFYDKILENINKEIFKQKLINQTINSFDRKGKHIIINLSNSTLVIHLRMEGKFKFDKDLLDKHSHIMFTFSDGSVLIYHDVRKFGRFFYFEKDDDINKLPPLNKLGIEPFYINETLYLKEKFKRVNKPIKLALLDQSIMAGIGNIYADEILFASKINPHKLAKDLNESELNEILANSKIILKEAIKDGGSTIKTFQSAHGVDGRFQQKLKVYGRKDLNCIVCNTIIKKEFIGKRGTCYCPNCQKG